MEIENMVKVIEVCKICPSPSNLLPSTLSLPLTDFDWIFLKFLPVQRLFFYSLPNDSQPETGLFESIIIPNLKLSLSLTLQHFFPLVGSLVWPDDSPLPFILCSQNDAVSFTLAESRGDFHSLSSSHPVQLRDSRSLLPPFHSGNFPIPMCAIQVTNFPNHHGYSIGFSIHHVINDGYSFNLFLKSWVHICKNLNHLEPSHSLPLHLIPCFDRNSGNMISNPLEFVPNDRNVSKILKSPPPSDWQLATFDLTPNHIGKLKRRALEYWIKTKQDHELHLSTFVVAYAHALVCLAQAKGHECKEKFIVSFPAEARSILFPPISTNYFGNCVVPKIVLVETRELREEENGFSMIAKKIGDLILELKASGHEVQKPKPLKKDQFNLGEQFELCSTGSSPKYKSYETDFGWGKPKQIEMLPLGNNTIILMDSRDGGSGIQLTLNLPTQQMDVFASLFHKCLH